VYFHTNVSTNTPHLWELNDWIVVKVKVVGSCIKEKDCRVVNSRIGL
jgi:hypothetical protein